MFYDGSYFFLIISQKNIKQNTVNHTFNLYNKNTIKRNVIK